MIFGDRRTRFTTFVLMLGAAPPVLAQQSRLAEIFPEDPLAAEVPFGPGERLEYQVKLGIFPVGSGYLTVEGLDSVRGHRTYTASLTIQGGWGPAKLHDVYRSWFDVQNLVSWRFIQDIHDPGYTSYRHYEMHPDRRRWEREDNDEFGTLGSALPIDDVGFLYFVRTLPLEVGKTYTLYRYFKQTGNPVILEVVGRAEREVPAGVFRTIVVKPTIRTTGLFGEGGNAELHFTDDERRILVYLRSEMPLVGSITLHLRSIVEGIPLHPDARAAALERRMTGETGPVGGR